MILGYYSYLGAALGYGFFTVLLLFSWRSSLQGKLLTAVVIVSAVWAWLATRVATEETTLTGVYQVLEVLRYIVWYIFLLKLFEPAAQHNAGYRKFVRWALPLSVGFGVLLLTGELISGHMMSPGQFPGLLSLRMTGHVLLAIIGLAIIEQLYRNTSARHRWSIKYLFIGAGAIFAFDLYLYADALLFRSIDQELWEARGIVNLAAVPFLAISAARNRDWSLNVFVSRDIVLNTTAIVGGGLYLLVMASAGYYLRDFGGTWGRFSQVLFFTLAIALLLAVMVSGQLRARLRVFLGKHFYKNKYDYRREWLRLTEELNDQAGGEGSYQRSVQVLADIIDARAGQLWLRTEYGRYENAAAWNLERVNETLPADDCLVRFLTDKSYVVNLTEVASFPGEYEGLDLPAWLAGMSRGWLVVPLFGLESLLGFVILANPLLFREINWEDRDLLKTAAKQVASHLSVLMTSGALAQARQFEVFNRLSAYMVHDLKNIAAELELLARNAEKHKGNPAFLEDAFETVESASRHIGKLLDQLRDKRAGLGKVTVVDLGVLVQEVLANRQDQLPVPQLEELHEGCLVVAEKQRLGHVLGHLIDNARQATAADGSVVVRVFPVDAVSIVEIRDNGCGMDADFIQNRLFVPFDTTKGNAGMGIGMYESREFVRQLGGEIHVESEPGKGTRIALHMPASKAQPELQDAIA